MFHGEICCLEKAYAKISENISCFRHFSGVQEICSVICIISPVVLENLAMWWSVSISCEPKTPFFPTFWLAKLCNVTFSLQSVSRLCAIYALLDTMFSPPKVLITNFLNSEGPKSLFAKKWTTFSAIVSISIRTNPAKYGKIGKLHQFSQKF